MKAFLHLNPNYTPRTIPIKYQKSFITCWWIFCQKYWTYFKTCWWICCQKYWTYFKTSWWICCQKYLTYFILWTLNVDGWICCQTSGSHAPRPLLEGGKGKNGRGKTEVATTTNIWKFRRKKNTSDDSKEIQNQSNDCWHLQSLPMGRAARNWEGTKFEQEFPRSVQVGWTGCCNDQFLHVGLVCYAVPQFILYRVSQKNVLIECCWSHVAQAQSPVVGHT